MQLYSIVAPFNCIIIASWIQVVFEIRESICITISRRGIGDVDSKLYVGEPRLWVRVVLGVAEGWGLRADCMRRALCSCADADEEARDENARHCYNQICCVQIEGSTTTVDTDQVNGEVSNIEQRDHEEVQGTISEHNGRAIRPLSAHIVYKLRS